MFIACRWAASFLDSGSSFLILVAIDGCSVPCFSVLFVDAQELCHRLKSLGEEEVSVFYFLGCPVPSLRSVFL
jgi:hypothetical protein